MQYVSRLCYRTVNSLIKHNNNIFRFSVSVIGSECHTSTKIMKVLHVAEKNDAAKNIAGLLARGNSRRVRK